ncbi:MAG TPA: hypothetical protein VEA15_02085 [Caulobacteraceae bacterium]|nr:hypothetical protein [Caulobacteraceae bacterium]
MKTSVVLLCLAALAGCASTTSAGAERQSEYERLARECQERGGILMPIPGANNANGAANHACEIRGPASARPSDRN